MKLKNKYIIITIIVASFLSLVIIHLNLVSHEKTQKIYLEQTRKTIIDLKKDFLKDTVNNIFSDIDYLRKTKQNSYKNNTEARLRRFQEDPNVNEEDFIEFFISIFRNEADPDLWMALLWNNRTGEILYNSSDIHTDTLESIVEGVKSRLSTYAEVETGDIKGFFGVSTAYIDYMVKKEVAENIRSSSFSNGSYIWVNEVLNYEGGKDYAIRRVHPNLVDTEGTYLSTDMEDIKGNLPYKEELEGINKDGEIVFTYFFKKLNSDQISEKITYAKLYKDYDWIIAMGVHLDDVELYTDAVNQKIRTLSSRYIIRLLQYILIVMFFGFTILYFIGRRHLTTSTSVLVKEISLDTVTKASSRRYGEMKLNTLFKRYRATGDKPAIMMLDIDDFKHVNDKYGHYNGDAVLVAVVDEIKHMIRSYDILIRWGGDEFVGIFPGLREEHLMEFAEKILDGISSLTVPVENKSIHVTVSMGFAYFRESDSDYNDVIKRADEALYKSKQQGKCRMNYSL